MAPNMLTGLLILPFTDAKPSLACLKRRISAVCTVWVKCLLSAHFPCINPMYTVFAARGRDIKVQCSELHFVMHFVMGKCHSDLIKPGFRRMPPGGIALSYYLPKNYLYWTCFNAV